MYIALPRFIKPAHISGNPYMKGITFSDVPPLHVWGLTFQELRKKYAVDYAGVKLEYQPVLFARMLAKIGYGIAVLSMGLERISECYVMPCILGKTDDVGLWVGCDDGPPLNPTTGLHAVGIWFRNDEILARIRLFAEFNTLEYLVCVGKRT